MLAVFASQIEGQGIFVNPLFNILVVILAVYIFLKFCSWAKKFQLTAGAKKLIYILTFVGMVVFNIYYSKGNQAIHESGDWGVASIALLGSLVWVFVFAFGLMADTKTE